MPERLGGQAGNAERHRDLLRNRMISTMAVRRRVPRSGSCAAARKLLEFTHALDPDHCPRGAAILVPLVSASGLGIALSEFDPEEAARIRRPFVLDLSARRLTIR